MNTDKPDFAYSATLRIFSPSALDFNDIEANIGFKPTSTHRRGDKKSTRSRPYEHDMWMLNSGIDKSEILEIHLNHLWEMLMPSKLYLLDLKKSATVDLFCGYRSDCDHAGIEISYESLVIFRELEIDFGLSILVA